MRRGWPAWLTLVVALAYVAYRLVQVGGDPRDLAEIGTRFSQGDPRGTEGYDGQFTLYIALQPAPEEVGGMLDAPAYRYQRILLPMTARALALGKAAAIPWTIVAVSLLAHVAGTFLLAHFLDQHGVAVGFALLYGLWAGSLGGVGTMLHEPLAYGLIAIASVGYQRERPVVAYLALGLALFAKETTLPFLAAFMLADIHRGRMRRRWWAYGLMGGCFLAFQGWLWLTFGRPGVGSGGAGATPFEWLPLMGFLRIARHDLRVFALYLTLFGPGVVLPALWGSWRSARDVAYGSGDLLSWALGLNALVILFLPFSTFREPFGLVRIATGLLVALVLYAADRGARRPLVYGLFWLAYLAMIL